MNKLRMRFSKTGRAIYISHLDLMATMQRAFSRAGNRLKYSEGFNPRPQISIALPLSVGCSSVCELMDFQLLEEQVDITSLKDRLNATMPEGIEVQEIYEPTRKNAELKWLQIEGVFEYDDRPVDIMQEQLTAFFARDSIVIEKKTKRGFGEVDIRPAIREISFSPGRGRASPWRLPSAPKIPRSIPTCCPRPCAHSRRRSPRTSPNSPESKLMTKI